MTGDVRDGRGGVSSLSPISTGINPTNKNKMDPTGKKKNPPHDFLALFGLVEF